MDDDERRAWRARLLDSLEEMWERADDEAGMASADQALVVLTGALFARRTEVATRQSERTETETRSRS